MKNICLMTVMLLLVSSCGLFKKTVKSKGSATHMEHEKIEAQSKVNLDTQRFELIQSKYQSAQMGEELIVIVGEGIELKSDGGIQVGKGKISRKAVNYSEVSDLAGQTVISQRKLDIQGMEVREKNSKLNKLSSEVTSRSTVPAIRYVLVLSIVVVLVLVWWKHIAK